MTVNSKKETKKPHFNSYVDVILNAILLLQAKDDKRVL